MPNQATRNLLFLRPRGDDVGRFAHTVYQEDLEEVYLLRKEIREATKVGHENLARVAGMELKSKLLYIETALRASARVEPGAHTAELVPRGRRFVGRRRLEVR